MTTELKQGSDEWFEARIGRITASNVGSILGLSPFRNRDSVMRSMVREYCGASSEFTGNIATEYGVMNEKFARVDYQLATGNTVDLVGFYPFYDWLGASPDGLIDRSPEFSKIVEFKCPFSLRNGGEFKPLSEQPHYYAQVQIQMLCVDVLECDFVQWYKNDLIIETVEFNEAWTMDTLEKLRAFYNEYLIERESPQNEKYLKSRHTVVENEFVSQMLSEYLTLKSRIKLFEIEAKTLLDDIVAECGNEESEIDGHKLTLVSKKSVSYLKAVKALIPDADLSDFETVTSYWLLK